MITRKEFRSAVRRSDTRCYVSGHLDTVFLMGRWPLPRRERGRPRRRYLRYYNCVPLERTSSQEVIPILVKKYEKMLEEI